ncbi:DUF4082 domain-containing protein [Rhizomonospora bruguierae]|uniref:DUF4082 domain-containing protein n=1 Tax=Rhizomonospora bruguierae TaxID=1581705 RepID=UPI001BD12489|nr:DUF4082 domain-containing protein [Micromonospora sp. NBRC 107566]
MADSIFAGDAPDGSHNDGTTYELGLGWITAVDGACLGVPVYGPSTAPSSCVVSLWAIDSSVSGTLLAQKTAPAPLTPGVWNNILFDAPVSVTAGVHYRVQYRTPSWYTFTAGRFTTAAVTVGPLTAFRHGVEPPEDPYPNGSLLVGAGYASDSGNGAWYGLDVLFEAPGGPITVEVGQATETDTAATLGRVKTKALDQAAELDAASAIGRSKTHAIGPAVEADSAGTVARLKTIHLGHAGEADSTAAFSHSKRRAIGQAMEVDTASPFGLMRTIVLGRAVETDTAAALSRTKRRTLSRAVETDTARSITTGGGTAAHADLRHLAGPQRARHLAGPQRLTHHRP